MAIKFANRVKVVTTTMGTGTITLGSAVAGFQTFADGGILNGNSVRYTILDGDAWEVGVGVYSSTGPTMTRTLDESSTGSLLNLSGDCEVFITTSAVDIENLGSRSIDQFQFTATSSQTIFTGNDDNANQLAFFGDSIIVSLNGSILELTVDYTTSGGDTITLTTGATAGDELNVVAFKSFTIADAVPTTGGAFTGNVDFGAGVDVTGNITVTGTVDGRDVAADGTKLDGIEVGATADQTAAEILTEIKTVDGSGSGLDADLLDGQHASAFATAAQGALADSAVQPADLATRSFTATNSIAAGQPVSVLSDGKIAPTKCLSSGLIFPTSLGSTINTNLINPTSSAYDTTSGKTIIAYCDSNNLNYGTVVVATVSDGGIALGTPVVFNASETTNMSVVFDSNANKVVISYMDGGNSNSGTSIVGTVSGDTITFGIPVVFNAAAGVMVSVFDSNSNKVVVAYSNQGNQSYPTAVVGTVSGDSITFGTPVVARSLPHNELDLLFHSASNQVILSTSSLYNFDGGVIVGAVSGDTIAFGSATALSPVISGHVIPLEQNPTTNQVVAVYDEPYMAQGIFAVVGTVGALSITFSSPFTLNNTFQSSPRPMELLYDATSDTFSAFFGSPVDHVTQVFSVDGEVFTNLNLIQDIEVEAASYDPIFDKNVIVSQSSQVALFQPVEENNISGFVGIAAANTPAGSEGKVTTLGGINGEQSALISGVTYYVSVFGNLVTGNTGTKAGKAVSSTEILVDTAMSASEMNEYLGSLV